MNKNKEALKKLLLLLLVCSICVPTAYAKSCKPIRPYKKYLANLSIESTTTCDDSGCQTITPDDGVVSNDFQTSYFLKITGARKGTYTYYLLDRKIFRDYQTTLVSECGQFTLTLPVHINPDFVGTTSDTLKMNCSGLADKKTGIVIGTCEGSFFAPNFNAQITNKASFKLTPTRQTIVNPCKTGAGILLYGSQCANR